MIKKSSIKKLITVRDDKSSTSSSQFMSIPALSISKALGGNSGGITGLTASNTNGRFPISLQVKE
jgi:hypothetical protein